MEVFFIPDTPVLASAEPVISLDLISTVGVAAWPVEADSLSLVSETSVSPVDSVRSSVVSLNLSERDASCRPPGSVSLDGLESGEGACPRTPLIHTLSSSQPVKRASSGTPPLILRPLLSVKRPRTLWAISQRLYRKRRGQASSINFEGKHPACPLARG